MGDPSDQNPSDLEWAVERTLLAEKDRGKQLTMRGLYAVVVDEVDNVLVDEAVTLLILYAPRENPLLSDYGGQRLCQHA